MVQQLIDTPRPIADRPPAQRVGQARMAPQAAIPAVVQLIICATFLPETLSFYVAELRLTVVRVIFLALAPVLLVRLGLKVSDGRYRFVPSDLLVTLAGVWMFLGPAMVDGIGAAMKHSGPVVLEFCIAYWSMRLLLSARGQARSAVSLLCGVIAIVALLGLLDPLTNRYLIHDWGTALTGYVKPNSRFVYRLGFLRASGPLEHSILYGFTCSIGILMAMTIRMRARILKISACVVGAVFSFSSAPIQAVFIGSGLLLYNRILARVPGRWFALIVLVSCGFTALFLLVDAPLGIIVRHLIFDPGSGYDRLLQWNVAGSGLLRTSPWFGMGFDPLPPAIRDRLITGSIDSLWLMSALTYGIPGSALIGLSLISTTIPFTRGPGINLTPAESHLGTGLSILMFIVMFVGFTVDLWGIDWILVALLMGIRAHLGELGRIAQPVGYRLATGRIAGQGAPAMRQSSVGGL